MKNVNLRVAHKPTSVLLDILVEYSGRLTIKFYKISSLSYKTWHFLRKPRLRGGVRLGFVQVKTDVTHAASACMGVIPVVPWMSLEVDWEMRKRAQNIFLALASYWSDAEEKKSNYDGHCIACTFSAFLLALSLLISSQSTALCLDYDVNLWYQSFSYSSSRRRASFKRKNF